MDLDVGKMVLSAQRNKACHGGWRNHKNKRIYSFQGWPIAHVLWGLASQMKELPGGDYKLPLSKTIELNSESRVCHRYSRNLAGLCLLQARKDTNPLTQLSVAVIKDNQRHFKDAYLGICFQRGCTQWQGMRGHKLLE